MKSNDYDEETTKRAEETAESFIRNNYQDIETVEIEKVYQSPMGGINVDGTVNGQYEFGVNINESSIEESKLTVGSSSYGEGFPDVKKECKDEFCDY